MLTLPARCRLCQLKSAARRVQEPDLSPLFTFLQDGLTDGPKHCHYLELDPIQHPLPDDEVAIIVRPGELPQLEGA